MWTLRALGLSTAALLALAFLPLPVSGPAGEAAAVDQDIVVIGIPCPGTYPPEFPIAIRDFFFDPDQATIDRGTVVNWTNLGPDEPHTTTDPGFWDSGSLAVGQHFNVKFCLRGFFDYLCTIHGFTGRLFVV